MPQLRLTYWASRFFSSPLDAFYTLLIFIITKELDATGLQLTVLVSAKPLVSLIAFYMNTKIVGYAHRIKNYLIGLNVMASVPAILFPFFDDAWYFIISYILFMISFRATYPAWTEMLKLGMGTDRMCSVISKGVSIQYFLTIFIPILCSMWMDADPQIWKTLFSALGLVQLCNLFPLLFLKPPPKVEEDRHQASLKEMLVVPWKAGWKLCRERADFTQFLVMNFIGAIGIVVVQPVLPVFFKETLHLSYQQLTLAMSLCKGVAFVMSSPLWASLLPQKNIYALNAYVCLCSTLFFVMLFSAQSASYFVFAAYLCYGVMQSGCELIFNMSAPIFSQKKESTEYAGINLALIGIRGMVFPFIGQLLFFCSTIPTVIVLSGLLCFSNVFFAFYLDNKYNKKFKSGGKTTPIAKALQ